ncbi:hypothetical protein PIB30_050341 [Stylosanthes scabra]|uniref:Pectinesterase inhibitor domain-containing protein n=1 Tax=Stylosanthes scabra TaxID=79078 RepID=A0ABU6VH19_9FABA|nr:hypothetical protein [Stylosanthes scabra]
MKTITLFFLIALTSSPSTIHCRTLIIPNDANLIESTCRRTPNYNVCIQSLKSNPASLSADVRGLALIMVKVMASKANDGINIIRELQRSGPSSALNSCAGKYNAILVGDIPQATQALQGGNAKFAESAANDVANEATFCENGFAGRSPITTQNNVMRDVSVVTAAIPSSPTLHHPPPPPSNSLLSFIPSLPTTL